MPFSGRSTAVFLAFILQSFVITTARAGQLSYFQPANVSITNFAVSPNNPSLHQPLRLFLSAKNSGMLASGPVTFTLAFTGSMPFSYTFAAPALSPDSGYNITLTVANASASAGSHSIRSSAYYSSNGTVSSSNSRTVTYAVANSPGMLHTSNSTYVPMAIPKVLILTMPVQYSLRYGTSTVSTINIQDASNNPITLHFGIPGKFSDIASLAASGMYLGPNSSAGVDMLFNPSGNLSIGSYSFPLNISATYSNGSKAVQTYLSNIAIINSTGNPTFTTQTNIVDYTSVDSEIAIRNHENATLYNVSYYSYLPLTSAYNSSGIKTSGLPSNITAEHGEYVIRWNIPVLPQYQTLYAYYALPNPSSLGFLSNTTDMLITPFGLSGLNILRIVSQTLPSLYSNSTSSINISFLYTGTSRQQLQFTLTGPTGIRIYNASQAITANPNQLITTKFGISSGSSTGTYIMYLHAYTAGANLSYNLPIIVSQRIQPASQGQSLPSISTGEATTTILILAVLIVALWVRVKMEESKYKKNSGGRLLMVKKRIEREGGKDA